MNRLEIIKTSSVLVDDYFRPRRPVRMSRPPLSNINALAIEPGSISGTDAGSNAQA